MPKIICYNCGQEFTYAEGDTAPACSHCSSVNYLSREEGRSRMRRLLNASLSANDLFEQETEQLDEQLAKEPGNSGLLWERFLCDLRVRYTQEGDPVFYRRIGQQIESTPFFASLWNNTPEKARNNLRHETDRLEQIRQMIEQEVAWATCGSILMIDCGEDKTRALGEKLAAQFRNAGLSYTVLPGIPAGDVHNFVALGNAPFLILLCEDQKQLDDMYTKSLYERFLQFHGQEGAAVSVCICTPSGNVLDIPPILNGAASLAVSRLDFNTRLWNQINAALGTGYPVPVEDRSIPAEQEQEADVRRTSMQELLSRGSDPRPGRITRTEADYTDEEKRGSILDRIVRDSRSGAGNEKSAPITPADRTPRKKGPASGEPAGNGATAKKPEKLLLIAGICAAVIALAVGICVAFNSISAQQAERARIEQENKAAYSAAAVMMAEGRYEDAALAFDALGDYADASVQAASARDHSAYNAAAALMDAGDYEGAAAAFDALGSYADAAARAGSAREALAEQQRIAAEEAERARIEQENRAAYDAAAALMNAGDYEGAATAFDALGGYADAAAQASAAREALAEQQRIAAEEAERARVEQENTAAYNTAAALMSAGDYEGAAAAFDALGGYGDAAAQAVIARETLAEQQRIAAEEAERARIEQENRAAYDAAVALMEEGDFEGAAVAFEALEDYSDANLRASIAREAMAEQQRIAAEEAERARIEQENQAAYAAAAALMNAGDFEGAAAAFDALGDFEDAAQQAADARAALAEQQRIAAEEAERARIEQENRAAYDAAAALMEAGDFEGAAAAFDALGEYDDAALQAAGAREALAEQQRIAAEEAERARIEQENRAAYDTAAALMEAGDFEGAAAAFAQLGDYADASQQRATAEELLAISRMPFGGAYAAGKIITLGAFKQTEDGGNDEPLEWIILDSDEDTALLICRFAPAVMAWDTDEGSDWEKSSVRAWLTGTFATAAFNAEEAAVLIPDEIGDTVSLLTVADARAWFADDAGRVCETTQIAQAQRGFAAGNGNICGWWLKDKGSSRGKAATVAESGAILTNSSRTSVKWIAVRPVIRIDLHILTGE
ncbi:MAG: hypothetical protein CW338_02390 [Clostridiales bacterium]|nr:hypothetical protein [Clostridiales bacterium]